MGHSIVFWLAWFLTRGLLSFLSLFSCVRCALITGYCKIFKSPFNVVRGAVFVVFSVFLGLWSFLCLWIDSFHAIWKCSVLFLHGTLPQTFSWDSKCTWVRPLDIVPWVTEILLVFCFWTVVFSLFAYALTISILLHELYTFLFYNV
jgi:hypothetical protein